MIAIENIQAGDTLVWVSLRGEIRGKVKRVADGRLYAFTDEVRCLPVEDLCNCPRTVLIKSNGERMQAKTEAMAPAQTFNSVSEAPVLF